MPAAKFVTAVNQCGSEPARDGGKTFNIKFECQTAIASRLAPTRVAAWCQITRGDDRGSS
ncbi:hypothetical protein EI534_26605 [Pseudomonas frederiksbergensis]|nr:hypothetical protein [Pseudomonas frederiksbergensis]